MTRVLVVDDERLVRRVVGQVLRRAGYEPVEAESAEEALALLADDVGLVLTDLSLPSASGLDLLDAVRERMPSLPVVLATGAGEGAAAASGRAAGVLQKPFRPDELLAAVRAVLGDRAA